MINRARKLLPKCPKCGCECKVAKRLGDVRYYKCTSETCGATSKATIAPIILHLISISGNQLSERSPTPL